MSSILHILTERPEIRSLAQETIELQSQNPENQIRSVELSENTDYQALVSDIFSADSVQVW